MAASSSSEKAPLGEVMRCSSTLTRRAAPALAENDEHPVVDIDILDTQVRDLGQSHAAIVSTRRIAVSRHWSKVLPSHTL